MSNSTTTLFYPTDPLLSRREAATYLGVKPATLEIWACTGRYDLPFVKIGRTVRYRQSHLDAWLDNRTRQGHAHARSVSNYAPRVRA